MGPFHWSDLQTRVALTMADDDITNNMLLSLKKQTTGVRYLYLDLAKFSLSFQGC